MNIDVGQIIAGKYELVRLLGKGAMGEVWLATHNTLGGEFAIKLVEPVDDIEAETAAGRFQLEAQIAAKLSRRTRHIVSVSDHGEENGLAYLVMELLEGESLDQRSRRSGPLGMAEVAVIVAQVARALSLAHEEGIFHRDLKPANVWLGKDEDGRLLVKLLDFGIARSQKPFRTRSPFATSKDMVLGTPSYMSPEQARGLQTLDYRCDLWALAVVAYEALTRKIPFDGDTVEDIFLAICTFRVVPALTRCPDLPPVIEAFFARAFAPKLDDRFASALELTEAFERLVSPEELEGARGSPISARMLAARASSPSHPDGAPLQTPPGPVAAADPFAVGRGSFPDQDGPTGDAMSVALQPGLTVRTRRRKGGVMGWLIATAGLIALLGLGVLAVASLRSGPPPKTTAADPPPNAEAVPSAVATVAASTTPPVAVPVVAEPPVTMPKATTAANGGKPSKPGGRPPVVAPHPAAPPPAPPPSPARPSKGDKGEVF